MPLNIFESPYEYSRDSRQEFSLNRCQADDVNICALSAYFTVHR